MRTTWVRGLFGKAQGVRSWGSLRCKLGGDGRSWTRRVSSRADYKACAVRRIGHRRNVLCIQKKEAAQIAPERVSAAKDNTVANYGICESQQCGLCYTNFQDLLGWLDSRPTTRSHQIITWLRFRTFTHLHTVRIVRLSSCVPPILLSQRWRTALSRRY
jgi:hypothetical protein